MCSEHTSECPVCRKKYLVFIEFCPEYHPPRLICPRGISTDDIEMNEGSCPSPVCPNSRIGGCAVI